MNHRPNDLRGIAVREALLAIIRARQAQGLGMPSYRDLGRTLGRTSGQISRHMGRLMDEGAICPVQVGMHIHIEMEARP